MLIGGDLGSRIVARRRLVLGMHAALAAIAGDQAGDETGENHGGDPSLRLRAKDTPWMRSDCGICAAAHNQIRMAVMPCSHGATLGREDEVTKPLGIGLIGTG